MIGNNIAALRKIRGLTQVDLARSIHVTQSAVSQWETGKTVPDLQQLYILSNFFGVSVDALTSEKGIIPTGTQKASPEPQKIDPHTYYAQKFGDETQAIVDHFLDLMASMPDEKSRLKTAQGAVTLAHGILAECEHEGKA